MNVNSHFHSILKHLRLNNDFISRACISHTKNSNIRFCSVAHSETGDAEEFKVTRKFIPITRKTLIRKLLLQTHLVPENEKQKFLQFTDGLERALSRSFQGVGTELKQLFDPLNPDKETMLLMHVGKKERLDNEFWLLEKLSSLLEKASFTEIPRPYLIKQLKDHPVYAGVQVHVDLKKYDVLKAWVLSEDHVSYDIVGVPNRVKYLVNVWLKKWPKSIAIYRRVVLAVRPKKQNKLMLKAFKDIPKNGLEYFLPIGRISMSKFDRGFIATTATIGALTVIIKFLSAFTNYKLHWTYVLGGVTFVLALKTWNAYKNKRNNHLAHQTKLLYFKTIANNRALLNLIVDRAEDEVFKAVILSYVFIRMENNIRQHLSVNPDETDDIPTTAITVKELQTTVQNWMKNRHNVELHFNPLFAIDELSKMGLLKVKHLGSDMHLSVLPLQEAIANLPGPQVQIIVDHDETLELEDIAPENDASEIDVLEKKKQMQVEMSTPGWQ